MDPSEPSEKARRAELLRIASRTFAVGIERLPGGLHEAVETAYLLLRVSDYLEDSETLPTARKVALLHHWAGVLDGAAPVQSLIDDLGPLHEDTPDAQVAAEAPLVLRGLHDLPPKHRAIVTRHVADTTRGMAHWAERGADFQTESDLDDYMHEVAGRVGWLLTDLFLDRYSGLGSKRDRLLELGRSFGLGLQTVNVVRGLHEDHTRGWLFIPKTFLDQAGVRGRELFDADAGAQATDVLNQLVTKADRHLADALEYTTLLPRRALGVRVFCALPLFFAVRTLALSRANPDVFHTEVKMERPEVLRIVRDARLRAWSNRWVRNEYERQRR